MKLKGWFDRIKKPRHESGSEHPDRTTRPEEASNPEKARREGTHYVQGFHDRDHQGKPFPSGEDLQLFTLDGKEGPRISLEDLDASLVSPDPALLVSRGTRLYRDPESGRWKPSEVQPPPRNTQIERNLAASKAAAEKDKNFQ